MNNDTPQSPANAVANPSATSPTLTSDPPPFPASNIPSLSIPSTPKDHLDRLLNDFSTLILILICATHYLDTFSLLLALRLITQTNATSAGPRFLAATTVLTFATHLFHDLTVPEGTEQWNHGGILVDFVGEKPTSRLRLLGLDVLVVVLQLLYLALHYKKLSLHGKIPAVESQVSGQEQDLEAEEAGISRVHPPSRDNGDVEPDEEGVEMDTLLSDGTRKRWKRQDEEDDMVVLGWKDLGMVFSAPPVTGPSEQQRNAARFVAERLMARIRQA